MFKFVSAILLAQFAEIGNARTAPGRWATCRMCDEDPNGPCGVIQFYQMDSQEGRDPSPIQLFARLNALPQTYTDSAFADDPVLHFVSDVFGENFDFMLDVEADPWGNWLKSYTDFHGTLKIDGVHDIANVDGMTARLFEPDSDNEISCSVCLDYQV